jgi:3-hydroxyacyl-[acyl-carrier-protein] dehydratase
LLRNDLYTTGSIIKTNSLHLVPVTLNPAHPIFSGHFPGQPVLPGVCMLEMVKEILEELLQQKLRISKGPQIKFLSMIISDKDPDFTIELHYEIINEIIHTRGKIFREQVVFMKYLLELCRG